MKRLFTLFVLAAIIISSVAACSEKTVQNDAAATETTAETSAETTSDGKFHDNLPDKNYDGKEFRILSYETVNCNGVHVVDEQNGEVVNDAQYELISTIEERFGCDIKEALEDGTYVCTNVKTSITAGENAYELMLPNDLSTFAFVQGGLVTNYSLLPYVDLSQPWWDQTLLKHISINNQFYYALGGIDLSHLDYTHVLVFSKKMAENYKLENPYELVKNGLWTFDKMESLMKVVTDSMNSVDDKDVKAYGYVATAKQVLPNFWMAAEVLSIDKDADDKPYFAVTGNEKFTNVFNRIYEMCWDGGHWMTNKDGNNTHPEYVNMLETDRALFGDSTFHYVKTLRTVNADFGLLPYPKWDENQSEYHSRVEGGTRFPIVPKTASDLEFISVIIEAISCESMNILYPAYYEVGLKGKVTRDEESYEMLDLIFASRAYDLGDTVWCNTIRDGKFRDMFAGNKRDLASTAAALDTVMAAELEEAAEIYKPQ